MSSELRYVPPEPETRAPEVRALRASQVGTLVGNTPLVALKRIASPDRAPIFLKMEQTNPSGSIRDRYVYEILSNALNVGQLVPGDEVVLSGLDDSAVAAALFGAAWRVRVSIFAPKDSSHRLLALVRRFGAQVHWTPAEEGLAGAITQGAEWARSQPERFYVDGIRRQAVRKAYGAMASEIVDALDGRPIGSFITSVSTGGTFREVSRHLRETAPEIRIGGAVLLDVDLSLIGAQPRDTLQRVAMDEVWHMRDELARREGILVGPKGAACVLLALRMQRELDAEQAIVALNPDAGQRYLGWEREVLFPHTYLQR